MKAGGGGGGGGIKYRPDLPDQTRPHIPRVNARSRWVTNDFKLADKAVKQVRKRVKYGLFVLFIVFVANKKKTKN